MSNVIVVVGPGLIGQAIARRVGVGKHVLLADLREDNASAGAEVMGDAGYEVSVAAVDASSREAVHALVETATGLGEVTGLIHAAGVSPSQASPSTILKVDLYGTALGVTAFGSEAGPGGTGVNCAPPSVDSRNEEVRGSNPRVGSSIYGVLGTKEIHELANW